MNLKSKRKIPVYKVTVFLNKVIKVGICEEPYFETIEHRSWLFLNERDADQKLNDEEQFIELDNESLDAGSFFTVEKEVCFLWA